MNYWILSVCLLSGTLGLFYKDIELAFKHSIKREPLISISDCVPKEIIEEKMLEFLPKAPLKPKTEEFPIQEYPEGNRVIVEVLSDLLKWKPRN